MALKVLIADDERLFRQSLKILLETAKDIKVVADAADGQEAVVKARETQPDIALLDVDMPKMDGIKAAKLITALVPKTKILMLSVYGDEEQVLPAIRAGAAGYVLKDTDREDFLKIIRHVQAGELPASPYLAHLTVNASLSPGGLPRDEIKQRFSDRYNLSEIEIKILLLLTEGLNNEEISRLTHLARETIKGHLKTIFRKLDVKNRTEAAVLAVREGMDQSSNGGIAGRPVRGD